LNEDAHHIKNQYKLFLSSASKVLHNGPPSVGKPLHYWVWNA